MFFPRRESSISRRTLFAGFATFSALVACEKTSESTRSSPHTELSQREISTVHENFTREISQWEQLHSAHIGVYALDTGNQRSVEHRSTERFMMCSTFKPFLVGLVLHLSATQPDVLAALVEVPSTLDPEVGYAPFTQQYLGQRISYGELCKAALQLSDNLAANLLLDLVGGPAAVTDFLHHIGNSISRLDRYESAMNYGNPLDLRDTTTPRASAETYYELLAGSALPTLQREQLSSWMCDNQTGKNRIRSGLPSDWRVADKTGTSGGTQGSINDIAVIWPDSSRSPVVLSVLISVPGETNPPESLFTDITRSARTALSL